MGRYQEAAGPAQHVFGRRRSSGSASARSSDYINEQGYRGFKLNGKKILIRGGGWTDDMLLDNRPKKVAAEVAYARHMNLNALRVEGFWGSSQQLYDLCDENGILIMVGWSCQWEWESYLGKPADERYGGIITPEDIKLVAGVLEGPGPLAPEPPEHPRLGGRERPPPHTPSSRRSTSPS